MYGIHKRTKLFNSSELAMIFYEFETVLSAIKELILKDEQTLKDTLTSLKNKIKGDKNIEDINNDEALLSSYFSAMYESQIQFVDEIHRQQRYSKLLILFVFYEDTLRKLTELKGLKGERGSLSYMEYYRNSILASSKINTSTENISFDYINSQRFVRNKIAHNNGVYNKSEKNKFNKQEGIEEVERGDEYAIRIDDPVYLTNLTDQIKINLTTIIYSLDTST